MAGRGPGRLFSQVYLGVPKMGDPQVIHDLGVPKMGDPQVIHDLVGTSSNN